jgi:hypothetical protein
MLIYARESWVKVNNKCPILYRKYSEPETENSGGNDAIHPKSFSRGSRVLFYPSKGICPQHQ